MDSYAGNARLPLSFNKFNYTHSSPVMGVDPSGRAFSLISVNISHNFGSFLRFSSAKQARSYVGQVLFGKPPKDLGIIGETILELMVKAVADSVVFGNWDNATHRGRGAHKELRRHIKTLSMPAGITLRSEVHIDPSGADVGGRAVGGSVSLDVLVYWKGYKSGKNPIAGFELKTGESYRGDGVAKIIRRFGARHVFVIQIKPADRL
jgi:hypothetical protein